MAAFPKGIPPLPPPPRLSRAARYLLAVVAVALAAGIKAALLGRPSIAPFVLFFLAVAVVSSLAGRRPGLVTVALSAVTANYWFITPFGAWSTSRDALTATGLFLVAATATALLCGSLRETFEKVEEREVLLRESQVDLNRAQAVARTGSWRLDVRRDELVWSDETHRIFGIPPGTPLTYETFLGTVHSEDRDLVDRAWRAALEGAPYEVEHRIVVAGEVRWVRERAQLEADDAGALRGGFGTVQDITEQKQAEETLRQSEERFRTIFESAGAGIAQVDLRTSRVMRANRRFAAITGYTQAELEGMPYLDLTHPEERASAASALNRAWEDGDTHADHFREGRYLRKDGTVIDLELYGSIIHDAADRPTHGIIVVADITERKRVERDLAAARISAEHAKAVAEEASRAKDHFLAVLSHELRTPLTPVLAGIALVERGTLSEEARHFLEVIRRNVELESRLIDDLLDLTRITRGKVELDKRLFELCTIIERAVDVCRPDIEARQLHFGIDWGPRPYVLYADGARLQQVFWNLLKNAIKFTPKGGCVGIRCRPDVAGVVVEVHDSGVGIERSAIGSIFDAFTQAQHSTARQFGGLGLGLTISKMLAEMHGGTIEARSEGPGRGSSFSVRLPIVSYGTARMSPDAAPSTRIEHHERTGTRVLLVEDHGDTAQTMVTVLEMAGYEVATAGDVATALDILDKQPFDLLISDLGLPDRSGLDLMRELRTRGSALPGIALSGYGMESDMEQSRAAGFLAHLVKPVEPARLLEAMQKALPKVGVH